MQHLRLTHDSCVEVCKTTKKTNDGADLEETLVEEKGELKDAEAAMSSTPQSHLYGSSHGKSFEISSLSLELQRWDKLIPARVRSR